MLGVVGTLAQQELVDRFRPRNLRTDAAGYAVMYDCPVHADGSAGLPDPVVRWQVLTRGLCVLCGDLLGDEVAFIGRPHQASRRRFSTPGMHIDCARFAFSAMPFFADGQRSCSPAGFVRSKDLVLYICPGYSVSYAGLLFMRVRSERRIDTLPLIKAQPASRIEPHSGWESMANLIAAEGGCPSHSHTAATGCREHMESLSVGERARIARPAKASDEAAPRATDRITNMRSAFAPRNLRIEANGFALTFDNALKPDGKPEFPTDMRIERRLFRTKRCLVCGDDLGSEVAFIGTTLAAESGRYPLPGMHVDCARYSFAACPFIAKPEWRPPRPLKHIRTPEMVFVIADSYRYAAWRWWWAFRRGGHTARANYGVAKIGRILHEERHAGQRQMLAYLNEQGGCPAHREQALTGSLAHADGASDCPVVL